MSQWQCDAGGPRFAGGRDSCAEWFAITTTFRAIAEKEGHEALMNYLFVESMALVKKFGITQGRVMANFDWRIQTEFAQMKAMIEAVEGAEKAGNNVQDPRTAESDGFAEAVAVGEDTGRAIQDFGTDESDGFGDEAADAAQVLSTVGGGSPGGVVAAEEEEDIKTPAFPMDNELAGQYLGVYGALCCVRERQQIQGDHRLHVQGL